jgi:hypothetical protein
MTTGRERHFIVGFSDNHKLKLFKRERKVNGIGTGAAFTDSRQRNGDEAGTPPFVGKIRVHSSPSAVKI